MFHFSISIIQFQQKNLKKEMSFSTSTTTKQISKSDEITSNDDLLSPLSKIQRQLEQGKQDHQKTKEELEILRYEFEQMKKDNVTRDLEMHKMWNELKRDCLPSASKKGRKRKIVDSLILLF